MVWCLYFRLLTYLYAFLQSGRNICRWPPSQVLGLGFESPDLGLGSCGFDCISGHFYDSVKMSLYTFFLSDIIIVICKMLLYGKRSHPYKSQL